MKSARRVRFFKAHVANKPGSLLGILQRLKEKKLGLCGLWGFASSGSEAEIYVVPKDPEKLRQFWKSEGILEEEGVGLWLRGTNRTGALNASLAMLARVHVNIESIDAVCVGGEFGSFIWVNPGDFEKAAEVLHARAAGL